MTTLLIAEHDHKQLKPVMSHVITAAETFGGPFDILVMGSTCQAIADEVALLPNVNKVLVADDPVYAHQLAENTAELIADLSKDYHAIFAAATTFGKNLIPRVAALLNIAMVSDVTKIISPDTFVRPIYAGNAFATVRLQEKIKILTIRATAFAAKSASANHHPAPIEKVTRIISNTLSQFESQQLTPSPRPELTAARIIISGGRGLKSKENFQLLEALADRLGAAVGASRAAVDAGFAPNDYQVGQTGKIVAPDLYIAVGISGAIQHLAGMKDSKVIVAINSDPDAPIFEIADYALVGDLFKILPELQALLGPLLSN